MPWSNVNHIKLLRYAGLFTYLCVGTPLITSWATERLSHFNLPNFALMLWTLCYMIFGLLYWVWMPLRTPFPMELGPKPSLYS